MATININEFIFGRTNAEKKLQVINEMPDADIRKATSATMLRVIKECMDEREKFYIKSNRREGNDWNSTIEYLYIHNGRPVLMLYVQGGNTDTSTTERYENFNSGSNYRGSCRLGSFSYSSKDIARTIRCILSEYVYYKWIEKDEREARKKVDALLHYTVLNPVLNYYYEAWRCKFQGGYPGAPHDKLDRYHAGEQAVKDYVKTHVAELTGKSTEELQAIYKKVFVGAIK